MSKPAASASTIVVPFPETSKWSGKEIFSQFANGCSVLGLILTLVVLAKVRGIHRDFLAQARIPDLHKKIREHRSALSKFLNQADFSALRHEIEAEMQKCNANLKNLKPKLCRANATSVTSLLARTSAMIGLQTAPEKDKVREVYIGLLGIEEELGNLSEDMKWRTRE